MSLCKIAPLWCLGCTIIGPFVGYFLLGNPGTGLLGGFIVGSVPIWLLIFAGIWISLATSENPRIIAIPLWLRPIIPLVFLGVPWLAALGLQLVSAERFETCRLHSEIARLVFAVAILPFWWIVVFKPDRNARKRALLGFSHLALQAIGLATTLPAARFLAALLHLDHIEWVVCTLLITLMPVLVYFAATVWLVIARNFASRQELLEVTQVQFSFDCWLFDKIVGRS